jgi:ribosomal protein L44E
VSDRPAAYRTTHLSTCPQACTGQCLDYIDLDHSGPYVYQYRTPGYASRPPPAPPRSTSGGREVRRDPEEPVDAELQDGTYHFRRQALGPIPQRVGRHEVAAITRSRGKHSIRYHVHYRCADCGIDRRVDLPTWRRHQLPLCPNCPEFTRVRAEGTYIRPRSEVPWVERGS